MNARDIRLVEVVSANPHISSADLSSAFDISERTLRTYVRRINEELDGIARVHRHRGGGYSLLVEDVEAWESWLEANRRDGVRATPSTPAERVSYLVNDLVMRRSWITLDDLSEMLYVSKSALSNDLHEVERRLAQFNLVLEKRPRYGLRVSGTEMSRRLCLAAGAMEANEGVNRKVGDAGAFPLADADGSKDFNQIAACVDAVLVESDFHINPVAHQNLLVHISIALLRIEEGCYVPMPEDRLEAIGQTHEFEVAHSIACKIGERLGIELPGEEVAYIAIHLAGKQTLYDEGEDSRNIVISDEVWSVVTEMLESVWAAFRFDFRNDLELRMNLARHIVPLSVRLRYNMSLKNPLLSDIRSRYPLAWSMATCSCEEIEDHWGGPLSDDEIAYIALAFALALERTRGETPRKNVLVVCASGAGSARLLEYRCRKEFGEYIDTISTCDVLHLDEADFSHVDYVFTTVPINRTLPVPVREVSHFFDASEVEGVRQLLRSGDKTDLIGRYFDRDLFFTHLDCSTKEEVLNVLCDAASARGVDASFKELVFKREEAAATSFGNSVAMPHPLEVASAQTFVTVGLLDRPVAWDGAQCPVSAVFLIAFSRGRGRDADRELDNFFGILADLFLDEGAIQRLVREQTWDTLIDVLGTVA